MVACSLEPFEGRIEELGQLVVVVAVVVGQELE